MKKMYILPIAGLSVLSAIVFPAVTVAAWWNPLTWTVKTQFTQPTQTQQVLPKQQVSVIVTTTTQEKNTDTRKPIALQEKIVTKTITVNNPAQQTKIDDLQKENDALKLQLNSESQLLSQISVQYNNVVEKYNSELKGEASFTAIMQKMVLDGLSQANVRLSACQAALGVARTPIYIPTPTVNPVQLPPLNLGIHCNSYTSFGTTFTNCN